MAKRKFTIVLIKPSHYDDDGYVIQWRRSTIPSNSLASVYGLLLECAEAHVLGPDVEIGFEIYDECNTIIDFPAVSKRILADSGMVALVGVQSNQFPRALDIGRQFRKQGVTVAVIDSGVDYTHADFGGPGTKAAYDNNDPKKIENGTFPTAKVIGGWDVINGDGDDTLGVRGGGRSAGVGQREHRGRRHRGDEQLHHRHLGVGRAGGGGGVRGGGQGRVGRGRHEHPGGIIRTDRPGGEGAV